MRPFALCSTAPTQALAAYTDELGNVTNRPHLVIENAEGDFDFRRSPHVGDFSYPDHFGANAPMAWKHWAESLY